MKTAILKSHTVLIAVTACALSMPGAAQAASSSGTFAVTATVAAVCNVSTTPVAFGAYDPTGAGNIFGTGTLSVACTKGAVISNITLGPSLGANLPAPGAYIRSMKLAAGTDLLGYDLYVPSSTTPAAACAYTTKWDMTAPIFVPATAPSNTARIFNVCGQTTQGQDVSAGSYSDSIAVTVNY